MVVIDLYGESEDGLVKSYRDQDEKKPRKKEPSKIPVLPGLSIIPVVPTKPTKRSEKLRNLAGTFRY